MGMYNSIYIYTYLYPIQTDTNIMIYIYIIIYTIIVYNQRQGDKERVLMRPGGTHGNRFGFFCRFFDDQDGDH